MSTKRYLTAGLLGWIIAMLSSCSPSQHIGDLNLVEVFANKDVRKLAWAAANGNEWEMDRLVAAGVDVNAQGKDGITPLWWAAWAQNAEGVQHLLERGAKPNVQPGDAPSSMEVASRNTRPEILRALIGNGGNPNLLSKNSFKYAPLHGANIGKSIECTKLLIHANADLDVRDKAGWTPFLQACILFNYDQAILLLEAGADYTVTINAHDGPVNAWTALNRGEERLQENSPADVDRRRLIEMLKARETQRQQQ